MAVRAGEVRLGRLSTRAVDQLERGGIVVPGQVLVGPPHQADEHGIEVERSLGEPVLVPVGVCAVADALEYPVAGQPARPPLGRPSPAGRLVEIPDSYTLIPLDQPARLAQAIRDFTVDVSGWVSSLG